MDEPEENDNAIANDVAVDPNDTPTSTSTESSNQSSSLDTNTTNESDNEAEDYGEAQQNPPAQALALALPNNPDVDMNPVVRVQNVEDVIRELRAENQEDFDASRIVVPPELWGSFLNRSHIEFDDDPDYDSGEESEPEAYPYFANVAQLRVEPSQDGNDDAVEENGAVVAAGRLNAIAAGEEGAVGGAVGERNAAAEGATGESAVSSYVNGNGVRRFRIPVHVAQAAVREIITNVRRDGDSRPITLDNLLHRLRRAIYRIESRLHREGGNARFEAPEPEMNTPPPSEERVESMEEEELPAVISFDTNLPAEHTYMGDNMDRVSGVNYLEMGQKHKILLFIHHHVLFPGEILPFMISGNFMENENNPQNGLFGLCFPFLHNNKDPDTIFGVTCQIYEKGIDERGHTLIKSRALQRFVSKSIDIRGPLQYIAAHPDDKCYGLVSILPEIYLAEPLQTINMGSMSRFRENKSMRDMYKRYQSAFTPWPSFIYDEYNISPIIEQAREELQQHKVDTMPTDPVRLSYWLVRNLHLTEVNLKEIFLTNSVNKRIRLITTAFNENALFVCRFCNNQIAKCRELFAMSKHGIQTQYCNSAGYIHETNTVYQLLKNSVSYSGEPSSEFSWFPGYQWHIVICRICSRHIGWEFTALNADLVPTKFFGISSSSVYKKSAVSVMDSSREVVYRILHLARQHIQ